MVWDISGRGRKQNGKINIGCFPYLPAGVCRYHGIGEKAAAPVQPSNGGMLDAMIAGSKEIVFQEEEDTLTGKLQSKLHRLCEIPDQKSQENEIQRRQLETMVADISHQVKTPIANVRMYTVFREEEPG